MCDPPKPAPDRLSHEAADEIERLRSGCTGQLVALQKAHDELAKERDEIERLRAALRDVISVSDRKTDIYDRAKAVLAGEKNND
jgi:hypothetical protein